MTEELGRKLHELDRDLELLRRKIWMVSNDMIEVRDREAEALRLEAEFRAMGDAYVDTYRAWSRQHAEE